MNLPFGLNCEWDGIYLSLSQMIHMYMLNDNNERGTCILYIAHIVGSPSIRKKHAISYSWRIWRNSSMGKKSWEMNDLCQDGSEKVLRTTSIYDVKVNKIVDAVHWKSEWIMAMGIGNVEWQWWERRIACISNSTAGYLHYLLSFEETSFARTNFMPN